MQDILDKIEENTFVCSDHHFGHKKIGIYEPIRHTYAEKLGYENFEDMIINEHNKVVKHTDTVLIIGDFIWSDYTNYIDKLNGQKIIILGNHDKPELINYPDVSVINGLLIDNLKYSIYRDDSLFSGVIKTINSKTILFSHYPVFNENAYRPNSIIQDRTEVFEELFIKYNCDLNIHGHLHSKSPTFGKCINISVENILFTPKRIKELI